MRFSSSRLLGWAPMRPYHDAASNRAESVATPAAISSASMAKTPGLRPSVRKTGPTSRRTSGPHERRRGTTGGGAPRGVERREGAHGHGRRQRDRERGRRDREGDVGVTDESVVEERGRARDGHGRDPAEPAEDHRLEELPDHQRGARR